MDNYCLKTVNTVLGSICVSALGNTLTCENILRRGIDDDIDVIAQHCHMSPYYTPSQQNSPQNSPQKLLYDVGYNNKEILLPKNITQRDTKLSKVKPTCHLDGEAKRALDIYINELNLFRTYCGGKTIMEHVCMDRDMNLKKEISKATNINIIVATGYEISTLNLGPSPPQMEKEEIYNRMYSDMEIGFLDYPDVKAGFIGAISARTPMDEHEKKCMRATGILQKQLRCPVSIHCKAYVERLKLECLYEALRFYEEEGGDTSKLIVTYGDETLPTDNDLLEFMDNYKCYVQFDKFGWDRVLRPLRDIMDDIRSIKRITLLKEEKQLHRVLISHNNFVPDCLIKHGGNGFIHIAKSIIPAMLENGFQKEDIKLMTVENPRRLFTRH